MNDVIEIVPNEKSHSTGITQFAVKTCIVAVIISACTLLVVTWIIDDLEQSTARTLITFREQLQKTPIGGPQFWAKIERELDRAADPESDLPPAKKQKLVNDVRVIVARWKPLLDAVAIETQKPIQ